MELSKIHRKRESLITQWGELVKKEKSFIEWLKMLEGAAFREGDHVIIENDVCNQNSRFATVRYTKTNRNGQIWVYITSADGF